jgi:hypothetical protein
MNFSLINKIKQDLNINDEYIDRILKRKNNDIIYHRIPKKNGKFRITKEIKIEFKPLQFWLSLNFFNLFPVSHSVQAYEKGSNILKNTVIHKDNLYFLKLDIENFFPSIDFKSFIKYIENSITIYNNIFTLTEKDKQLLYNCCFDDKGVLAQGFSTSPLIANRILYELDTKFEQFISLYENDNLKYTRYSDDLIFSCFTKGLSYKILNQICKIISENKCPVLKLNKEKISFGSVGRGNVLVTGLKIKNNEEIDLTKKKKDEIKLLLSLFKKQILDKNEYRKLKGNLEFTRYNSPKFYTQLCIKYYDEISALNKFK